MPPVDLAVLAARLPHHPLTRFAPSPSGYLHLGHVANAVWVWGLARALRGRVLLWIEDHDRGRCRPAYETALLDDLDWLGLAPDVCPTDELRAGPSPLRQSDAGAHYEASLEPGAGRGLRVRIDPGAECFVDGRLGRREQDPSAQCGVLLVRDRLGQWTYQFAVVVDDRWQAIDLVVRGEDLIESTGRQIRLRRMLGGPSAPMFLHHPLIRNPAGDQLSKSRGDTAIRELRAAGETPAAVLGRAAHPTGLQLEPRPIAHGDLANLCAGD